MIAERLGAQSYSTYRQLFVHVCVWVINLKIGS